VPDEPPTAVARVRVPGTPSAGRGGRHARGGGGGGAGLPPWLSIRNALFSRGRIFPSIVALVLMLAGAGLLGGTAFLDSVKLSSDLALPGTTTVLYSDGSVLAKLGEVTRYELDYEKIEDPVIQSIVASEDQTFWTNEGVDLGGVIRAAWNNFTGGETQGGSTITQQYARLAFDLDGVTYQRKAREAVLAYKMNRAMTKEQILEAYLNAVPFGRQAYGIEAAARAFFGKTANKEAPPEQQLTWAEAMVLVAMVKQPYPDPADPIGHPGYDPTVSPEADANARQRFDYVRQQLVAMGSLSEADAAALVFPENVLPYTVEGNGLESPAGMVVNHVLSELTYTEGSPFYGAKDWKFIREGGYQIYTTLHRGAQEAAQAAASRAAQGGPMAGQPENLQGALVAVQPGTGRVLAYYGGDDGKGSDYAGIYIDEHGEYTGVGRYPPGSSYKVYTAAAALKANISLKSYWDWNPHDMPGRTGANRIQNVSTCGELKAGDDTPCSLLQSTISSLNVPYYAVTLSVTPTKVLETARDMGIDYMWTDARERHDLRGIDIKTVVPSSFDTVLGIGQYPITVLDHANGLATVAAAGLRAQAHFVQKVMKGEAIVYGETLPRQDQPRVLTPQQANDLTYALSQVSSAKVNIGWDTAGKTGTWEYAPQPGENAHAWMVGFSRKIAAAVWVGNHGDEARIRDKSNAKIYGSGLPAKIWQSFMSNATKAMNEPRVNTKFNAPNFIGDTMPPGAVPSPNGRDDRFTFPFPTRTRR
jgi:membrane peptidoglycan carboxypeptidase